MVSGNDKPAAAADIMPQKAYLVFTKENWGCLGGQEITADVTPVLTSTAEKPVHLREVKNPEDVNNRCELYLYYPAQEIRGLPGYFILRLGVVGQQPETPGSLSLWSAVMTRSSRGLAFTLTAKTAGLLKADLLYAGTSHLESGRFTCPEADLFEAHPVDFLPAYLVHPEMPVNVGESAPPGDKIVIPLEESWLRKGSEVAACYALLSALESDFSLSTEKIFFWDRTKLTATNLNRVASSLEKDKGWKFLIKVELRGKQGLLEIERNSTPFVPLLQQTVSVPDPQEKVTGGKVSIGLERLEKR